MTEFDPMTNTEADEKTERFLHLLTENQGRVYAYILSLCPHRSDADDIMQDTITVMWRKFADYKKGTDFIAWAITIAKYTIFSFMRKKKKGHLHFDEATMNTLESKSKRVVKAIDSKVDALEECLKKLPDSDAKLLKLRYFEDLSVKIIATRFDRSTRNIYKNISRVHLALIRCIKRSLAREVVS